MPFSRCDGSSRPSRNAPCSVKTSFVPSPSGVSSTVASETEIRALAHEHVVRVDDPLVRDDVLVAAFEREDGAVHGPGADLAAADPEVQLVLPVVAAAEPAGLGDRVGPGLEDARRRHGVAPLDGEGGVRDVSFAHVVLSC